MNDCTIQQHDIASILRVLNRPQRQSICELGSRGPGGSFDPIVMSALYTAGLVTVGEDDRRVKLTELGRLAYAELTLPGADTG
jgi:hypothetical protein